MKALIAATAAAVLAVAGCAAPVGPPTAPVTGPGTTSRVTPSATASTTASATPTPSPTPFVVDVPIGKGRSTARVLVSDPDQRTTEWVQKDFGPDGFAVSGNLIVVPNEVRGDVTIYRDGRPILRKSTGDAYVYDVALRDGVLYLLEGVYVNAAPVTQLRVYSVIDGGRKLRKLRTRRLELGDNSSSMTLDFVGDSLIASSVEGESVVASGPEPPPTGGYHWSEGKDTVTIQREDGTWAARLHAHDEMEADFLGADDTWFWCAVYDWAGQGYVYRVPLVGGHTQAYRLQPPGESVPDKAVFIDNGLVYQLLVTRNATAAKVLLIGPAS